MKVAMITLSILCVGQSFMLGRAMTLQTQANHAQHEVNRAFNSRMLSIERDWTRYGVYEPCCRGVSSERDI
jgi:type II secretory pathway component PulJ